MQRCRDSRIPGKMERQKGLFQVAWRVIQVGGAWVFYFWHPALGRFAWATVGRNGRPA
jgi:hypothetical protein